MVNASGNLMKNLLTKSILYAKNNYSSFLIYTTCLTFGFAMIGQMAGIKLNKKIPEKERNFLLFQELLTGIIEIGIALVVGKGFEKIGAKLVDRGLLLPFPGQPKEAFTKGLMNITGILGTVLAFHLFTPLLRNPLAAYFSKKMNKETNTKLADVTRIPQPASSLNAPSISTPIKSNINPFEQFERKVNLANIKPNLTFKSSGLRI